MTKLFNEEMGCHISRRSFLGASVAASAAMLAPGLLAKGAQAAGANNTILTATHWGVVRIKVENGRIKDVTPYEKDPRPTPMLKGVADLAYSPSRIRYPLVRAGYLKDGPNSDRSKRGAEPFVRVSWDQALDLIVKEFQRVHKEYGPTGVYGGSLGWKSVGKLHNCVAAAQRFMEQNGGYVSRTGDYSSGATQVIMPHVIGSLGSYEQSTAWPVVVRDSKLVVIWGADPMVTNQIGWVVPDHGAYEGMKALKEAGTKVIVIDPVRTETAKFLNAEWIAPRPQSDVAIMLAIAHTLYTEKLHDQKFLDTYCVGFDQFLPYLLGETDKTPKTAEWAAHISGLEPELIKRLARDFAKNRTMLMSGFGMQRQQHGEQPHWALVTVACMLGQIGLPGGGFSLSYHYNSSGSPAANGAVLPGLSNGSKSGQRQGRGGGVASIPCARLADMLLEPGKVIDANGKKVTLPDVRMTYWVGGNPIVHHQDTNRLLKAWQKFETVIVQDYQWTPTCRHADIVLPATTTFERNDIEQIGDYTLKGIVAMHKVIEPMFEARNDYDICLELAKRMGNEQAFSEGKAEMDWIGSFYEAAAQQAKAKKVDMPSFDDFWNGESIIWFPITDAGRNYVKYKEFRDEPLLEPLGTPSGKFEIYSKNIEKMGYDDCPPHAAWMEPQERLGGPSEASKKHPFHLTCGHPAWRLHSQLCGTSFRKTYAVADREPCLINTKDAAAKGIKSGDVVRVFNDRGQILVGAIVTDDVRPGVIRTYEGAWYDPQEPGKPGTLCKYGLVNVLTYDIGSSKLAQATSAHSSSVDFEKYKGNPPPVTAFNGPIEK